MMRFALQRNACAVRAASRSGRRALASRAVSAAALARLDSTALPEFQILESTLREGEQFYSAEFTAADRKYIATMLDRLGVDYIELVNPVASRQAARDCEMISQLRLKRAKVVAHTRCHMKDVQTAVETGVAGVNVYMATSAALTPHSHGKSLEHVLADAHAVVDYVLRSGVEVRFSCEDAFRSDLDAILPIYAELAKAGVHRVGVADTVGVATPWQVFTTVAAVREAVGPDVGIEFHTHNDTGCCISNAYMALLGGATLIDTTVLGIGERNGITPLGGFLARLYTLDKDAIKRRFDLPLLRPIEKFVASVINQSVPFNNYLTGSSAFTHKAGVHSKAVMSDPGAYEVVDPADFGVQRAIQLAHRLTGWNAIQQRSKELGLELRDDELRAATSFIKNLAEEEPMTLDQIDTALIKMATGPRVSSLQFLQLTTQRAEESPSAEKSAEDDELREKAAQAAKALEEFTLASAKSAVHSSVKKGPKRLQARIRVSGHLLDKGVLNALMDSLVDSPSTFQVESIDVPQVNEGKTTSTIVVRGTKSSGIEAQREQIRETLDALERVVNGLAHVADCMLEILEFEDEKVDQSKLL